MNKKGFLLVDSLITIFIVSAMSILCITIFKSINNYKEGYQSYKEETNERLNNLYNSLGVCERCVIQEDSPVLEP